MPVCSDIAHVNLALVPNVRNILEVEEQREAGAEHRVVFVL